MANPTEKFQNIWIFIFDLSFSEEESISKQEALSIQEEKFKDLEKLIDDGADINEPFYNNKNDPFYAVDEEDMMELYGKYTPLSYVLLAYYCSRTQYMGNDFLDNMVSFLFTNDVVIDEQSIKSCLCCNEDSKLLYEILQRSNDIKLLRFSNCDSLLLEIFIGFSNTILDEFMQYEFSYVDSECIYFQNYDFLPIEVVILDYCTERGLAFKNESNRKHIEEKRKDVIRLFKINGSPPPSLERIDKILSIMSEKNTWKSMIQNIRQKFIDVYEYYKDL